MVPWVGLQFVMVAFPGPFFLRRLSYLGSVGFLFRYGCQYWDEIGVFGVFVKDLIWGHRVCEEQRHPRSLISAFVLRLLKSIISRLTTSELSIF